MYESNCYKYYIRKEFHQKNTMAERNTNTWLDTPDPQVFIKNSAKFNDLMMMYRCTVREVRTKLEVLNDEFSLEYKRNPISFIKTRIKKPESIYKKLKKLGYEFTAENIQNQLNDVAGIRVVCAFIDDIYTIADLITKQDDIRVIQVKDYIKNPKPNGYRSYHMIVEVPVFFTDSKRFIRVEVQIRTIAMDFWASLEHDIRYKVDKTKLPEGINDEMFECAGKIAEIDRQMQDMYQRSKASDAYNED